MNAFAELWRAVLGWLDLITARPGAAEKFNLSRSGLINAAGFYVAVVLLILAVESSLSGFPGWVAITFSLLLNALIVGAIWFVVWLTAQVMRADALAIAVPVTYAMGFVLALSLPLAHLGGGNVIVALLGVRAFLFYRAAREVGKLGMGISVAFAILCVAVLAAIPLGLYMLTSGGLGIG